MERKRPGVGPDVHADNVRLHQRWLAFQERKKRPVIANVVVARELAGWCWSLATLEDTGAARCRPVDGDGSAGDAPAI